MNENVQVIGEFIEAWSRLDAAELVDYFTEDGTYHNMPMDPISGRDNLIAFIGGFIANWTQTDWDVLNITGSGNTVFAERVDRTRIGEKSVELPCCGVFEMDNGKIRIWRDYFDLSTFTRALE